MKDITLREFLDSLWMAAIASAIISAVVNVISAADVLLGEFNWNSKLFLQWWLILGMICWVVFIVATIYDNRREAYADNE